jgi:hypothetical protein
MDPQTRQEKRKNQKEKGKGENVYTAKHVRNVESLLEKKRNILLRSSVCKSSTPTTRLSTCFT